MAIQDYRVGRGERSPGLGAQLRFFCERLGISISLLDSRLRAPKSALKQHLSDDDGVSPGLAGILQSPFPQLDGGVRRASPTLPARMSR